LSFRRKPESSFSLFFEAGSRPSPGRRLKKQRFDYEIGSRMPCGRDHHARDRDRLDRAVATTDTRLKMRYRTLILLAMLCASPFAAHAVDIGGRVGAELSCNDSERHLVGALNYKRGQGVAKETLLADVANFADAERLIAEYRIEDVYLDPALTLPTIAAYRMERCLRRFERRNYLPYNALVRERLLRCQNDNAYGSRKFARCIDDLLHVLEDKVNEAVESR
jgi:hypothetical protein